MIPLRIGIYDNELEEWVTKDLWQIMEPSVNFAFMTEEQKIAYAIQHHMLPTEVKETAETYCRDAERTANYELENITNVNAKAKPEFTWSLLKAVYVQRLLEFIGYTYNYKNSSNVIIPKTAVTIKITYLDFIGMRTIDTYLGQTIEGTLVEYDGVQYWENFRIAFPER